MQTNKFNYLKYFVNKQINDLKEEKDANGKLTQIPVFSMHDSICNSLAIYETIKGIMVKDKLWEGQ